LHGDLTFPHRTMQQTPEPDRPRWAIPFTITDGPAGLPPPPQTQAQTMIRGRPPPGELKPTPDFSGIHEPVTVRGEGFEPGKTYALNWTRVIGNRISAGGWEEGAHEGAQARAAER